MRKGEEEGVGSEECHPALGAIPHRENSTTAVIRLYNFLITV